MIPFDLIGMGGDDVVAELKTVKAGKLCKNASWVGQMEGMYYFNLPIVARSPQNVQLRPIAGSFLQH